MHSVRICTVWLGEVRLFRDRPTQILGCAEDLMWHFGTQYPLGPPGLARRHKIHSTVDLLSPLVAGELGILGLRWREGWNKIAMGAGVQR